MAQPSSKLQATEMHGNGSGFLMCSCYWIVKKQKCHRFLPIVLGNLVLHIYDQNKYEHIWVVSAIA